MRSLSVPGPVRLLIVRIATLLTACENNSTAATTPAAESEAKPDVGHSENSEPDTGVGPIGVALGSSPAMVKKL